MGEKDVGPVTTRAECVEKAKAECPDFDLAHTKADDPNYCWCQKLRGDTELRATDS